MKRTYPVVYRGQWVTPCRKEYRLKCCDCGLVHVMQFRLVPNRRGHGRKIAFRAIKRYRRKETVKKAVGNCL